MWGHGMALEARGLVKRYGEFTLRADFTVADGETLVLAGPSGCGKTTALNLVAGLTRADAGEILIDGRPVTGLPAWKRGVSVVFQDLALFPHLSVGGNVAYGPFIRGMPRRERRALVERLLALVRLSGYEKRPVATLSGGERQRVAIARALAVEPRALLLDEPFSSLDAPLRASLRRELRGILKAAAFPCVFVTHDREEAAVLGDRIALMRSGAILETGAPRRLWSQPATEFGCRFFGSGVVLPAMIVNTDEKEQTLMVDTPLGRLCVRAGAGPLPKEPRVFLPWDSLAIAQICVQICTQTRARVCDDAPAGSARVPARCVEVTFEGGRLRVDCVAGGLPLSLECPPRARPPAPGEEFALIIDEARARLVEAG